MRILSLALPLLLAAGGSGQVTTLYVPDANAGTGTCNVIPFGPFGSGTNVRAQFLLSSADLGATPFKILDIGFAACSTTTLQAQVMRIQMAHTTTSLSRDFCTNLGRCAIQVLGQTNYRWSAPANQWSNMGLQCPFGYDGQRNLVIDFQITGRSGGGAFHRQFGKVWRAWWYGTTDPAKQCAASGADGAGLKIALTIAKTSVLTCTEQVKLGAQGMVVLHNGPPGHLYQLGTSFTPGPPIQVGTWRICIGVDNLLVLSLLGIPLFQNYNGVVPPSGKTGGTFSVPNLQPLVGLCLYHVGVTAASGRGITSVTNPCATLIVP